MDPVETMLGADRAARLRPHLEPRTVGVDEAVVEEGSPQPRLWFLLTGVLHARTGPGDDAVTVGRVEAPAVIGEIGFADGGAATVTLVAHGGPATFLALHRDALSALVDTDPALAGAVAARVTSTLAERLVTTSEGVLAEVGERSFDIQPAPPRLRTRLRHALGRLLGAS